MSVTAGSTANYWGHLERKHSQVYKQLKAPPKPAANTSASSITTQSASSPFKGFLKKYPQDSTRQKALEDAVVDMFSENVLALQTVESKSFKSLMHTADPQFQVPSRKHLSKSLLPARHESKKAKIKDRLQQVETATVE